MSNNKPSIGGQAVIEGVMMRGTECLATAVRRPSGEIVYKKTKIIGKNSSFAKKPFIRGVLMLFESLVIGVKELTFSANQAGEDDEKLSDKEAVFTTIFSLALGIGIFIVLPSIVGSFFFPENRMYANLTEAILRLIIFIGYIWGISFSKEVGRVFEYHGAEHKSIYTYENGLELTPENAKKFTTLHPRCGTSFLFIVMFIAIFVNTFLEYGLKGITATVRLKEYLKKDFNISPILTEKSNIFGIKVFNLMIFEDKSEVYFIGAAFIIILIGVIFFVYNNLKVKGKFENKASLRKEKWRLIVNRRWAYFAVFLSFVMLFSTTYLNYLLTKPVELTAAQPYQEEGNNIVIPLSDVDDGHLHRFSYKKDGHDIRFIVVKKPNSTSYGVGLDACQICGVAGYFERKNDIVCKRCDVVMNKATIGFKGGCNPIPFEYKIENSKIIIDKSVLDKEKERFPIGE